jgi:HemY protein
MRRIVMFVVLVAALVACAWLVADLPGFVSLKFGNFVFEARAPVALLLALVLFIILYLTARLIGLLFRGPRHFRHWRGYRRREMGDRAVTRTLLALAAGEPSEARREAGRARRLLGPTPQTLLLSAEAGRLSGDKEAATEALRALADRPDAAFLGYRGLVRQAMEREDWDEAASLAREAEKARPGAAWLRTERSMLAIRTGAWSEALALADPASPRSALAVAAAEVEPDQARAMRIAKRAWKEARGNPAAALVYARKLREAGKESAARAIIAKTWLLAPQPELAKFVIATREGALSQLEGLKQLVARNPAHTESRIAMAEGFLAAGRSLDARKQIEALQESGCDERRMWTLLADIDDRLGDGDASREALRRATRALDNPGWRCDSCGAPAPVWRPVCLSCQRTGTLAWAAAGSGKMIEEASTAVAAMG